MLSGDSPTDDARAAARARLAARAAHVEGGLAAAAAAEAAVASVAAGRGGDELRPVLSTLSANIPAHKTPAPRAGFKRSHIVSPPMKNVRVKNDDGLGINVARAARDLCGDLGEPKESLMRRALDCIGVVEANDIAIQVYRIEGDGGQMTRDGVRRRTPGGVFWALLKERVTKEEWADIFAEEKEVQRERCRRRRRAASAAASLAGSPTFKSGGGFASLKTPALSNALSKLSADAPARATMTSKLRETVPAGSTPAGSWAARAKAGGMQGSFARANSAPASVLASAAKATPAKRIAAVAKARSSSPSPRRPRHLSASSPPMSMPTRTKAGPGRSARAQPRRLRLPPRPRLSRLARSPPTKPLRPSSRPRRLP